MDTTSAPTLRHLFTLEASLSTALDAGDGPLGRRSLNAVSKGTFTGDRMRGRVNPGTGDWMLTRQKIRVVDARIVLITDDGGIIHMTYGGRIWFDDAVLPDLANAETRHLIDRARYYFRTTPTFETGHPNYLWLNGVVSVGTGRLIADGGVAYDVFEVT
jgi:hypothetical protein